MEGFPCRGCHQPFNDLSENLAQQHGFAWCTSSFFLFLLDFPKVWDFWKKMFHDIPRRSVTITVFFSKKEICMES